MSSNSIQKMVDIFNAKNIGDKDNPNQKEKNNDNFSSKMPKKENNKEVSDINKNLDKRASMPLKNNNNINNNINKEKEDIKIGHRKETILSHSKKEQNPIMQEKKLLS